MPYMCEKALGRWESIISATCPQNLWLYAGLEAWSRKVYYVGVGLPSRVTQVRDTHKPTAHYQRAGPQVDCQIIVRNKSEELAERPATWSAELLWYCVHCIMRLGEPTFSSGSPTLPLPTERGSHCAFKHPL